MPKLQKNRFRTVTLLINIMRITELQEHKMLKSNLRFQLYSGSIHIYQVHVAASFSFQNHYRRQQYVIPKDSHTIRDQRNQRAQRQLQRTKDYAI